MMSAVERYQVSRLPSDGVSDADWPNAANPRPIR
jgi:hypothetical protein